MGAEKSGPHRGFFFFFLYSLVLCFYFIRICRFVLIVLHCAFAYNTLHKYQCPRQNLNPQPQQVIGRSPSPFRSPDRAAPSVSPYRMSCRLPQIPRSTHRFIKYSKRSQNLPLHVSANAGRQSPSEPMHSSCKAQKAACMTCRR